MVIPLSIVVTLPVLTICCSKISHCLYWCSEMSQIGAVRCPHSNYIIKSTSCPPREYDGIYIHIGDESYFKVEGRDLKSKYINCKRRDGDVQSRGGGEPPHSGRGGGGVAPALFSYAHA